MKNLIALVGAALLGSCAGPSSPSPAAMRGGAACTGESGCCGANEAAASATKGCEARSSCGDERKCGTASEKKECPAASGCEKADGCGAKAGCDEAGECPMNKEKCGKDEERCEPESRAPAAGDGFCVAETRGPDPQETASLQQTLDAKYLRPGDLRTFRIEYAGKIRGVPAGTKRLRVWFPVPQNSTVQTIRELSFSREGTIGTEPKYGNRIAHWEIADPAAEVDITMSFVCDRREVRMDLENLRDDGRETAPMPEAYRMADELVIIDDEIRELAARITKGRATTLEKARAVYDHVLEAMSYDKSHEGWGLGSTRHACEVGKGNCTDFHALFNSLCRAAGIASGFEIGLYLPYDRNKEEKLGGYHCWAFFRVPGKSWVPVDCSEADRYPERRAYFFGSHTSNRVTLSTGRDLVLEPRQEGAPLNYFLTPYAEADGKPVPTDKDWSYQDLEASR